MERASSNPKMKTFDINSFENRIGYGGIPLQTPSTAARISQRQFKEQNNKTTL